MIDYKDRIGTHAQFDDARYWAFTRNTGLPHGTFGKRHSVDRIVFIALAACLAVALAVVQL